MENQEKGNFWEAVFVPKDAVVREFTSKNTGKTLKEVELPQTLPQGAPRCEGWHFYMPVSCVHEAKSGDMRISFPPTWKTVRFLSPYVKGQRSDAMEFPIDEALALLRDTFGNH